LRPKYTLHATDHSQTNVGGTDAMKRRARWVEASKIAEHHHDVGRQFGRIRGSNDIDDAT
jgi:hypothetical protein